MIPLKDLLERNDWKKYRYKIKLKITGRSYQVQRDYFSNLSESGIFPNIDEPLTTSDTFTAIGSFSFLHVVILAQKIKILKYLIDNHKGESCK